MYVCIYIVLHTHTHTHTQICRVHTNEHTHTHTHTQDPADKYKTERIIGRMKAAAMVKATKWHIYICIYIYIYICIYTDR